MNLNDKSVKIAGKTYSIKFNSLGLLLKTQFADLLDKSFPPQRISLIFIIVINIHDYYPH